MSVAEGSPTISPMIDPGLRESRDPQSRLSRLGRAAIIAAALFHVGVIGGALIRWPALFHTAPPVPPPIAVTLVTAPPAPAPAPAPKVAPPPPPPPAQERVSGADNQTTAPPAAAEKAAEAAPAPDTLPPQDEPTKTAVPVPKPEPNPAKEPRPAKPKLAEREAAPTVKRGAVNRAPGDTERSGDPYLNRVWAMIEQHRTYPPNAVGSLGLPLEGTSVYIIEIAPNGTLLNLQLERSSGAAVLDQAAARMIQSASPFPPPPRQSFPGAAIVLEATIHVFPGSG